MDNGRSSEALADNVVRDVGGLLFQGLADSGQHDDTLLTTDVLLVDTKDTHELVDRAVLVADIVLDKLFLHGDGQAVGLDAAGETTDGDLGEEAAVAGDLGLLDHTDGDALS